MKSFGSGNHEIEPQSNLLLGYVPRRLRNTFGIEYVAWVEPGAPRYESDSKLTPEILEQFGFDSDIFAKACNWEIKAKRLEFDMSKQEMPDDVTTSEILNSYNVMDYILNGGLERVDLAALLMHFKLPEVEFTNSKIKHYSLEPLQIKGTLRNDDYEATWNKMNPDPEAKKYDIYLDTPVGFALMYKGKPNAVAGVAPMGRDELRIFQIQGVTPQIFEPSKEDSKVQVVVGKISARGLARIDWRALLIEATCEIARDLKIPVVGVQPAEQNQWVHLSKLGKESAIQTYDQKALQMGFSQTKSGRLYKPV
jgi:hypothetical protein